MLAVYLSSEPNPDILYFGIFFIAFIVIYIWLIFWPWRKAQKRRHRNSQAIFMLCLFLGWTTLGWIAAWIWAYTDNVETDDYAYIQPTREVYSLTGRRI